MTSPKSAEIFQIAVHEMGHFEAASYYGIAASPKVFREAEKFKTPDGKTIVGECKVEFLAKATLFQKSVIGWSGNLAEQICGVQNPSVCNPFPLQKSFLKDFYYAAIADAEKIFSLTDQILIFGYSNHWLSFKAAYRILKKEKSKLLRVAKSYQINFQSVPALPGIPSPETFPATHADFIRVVCDNTPERFEQFITSRAIAHLAVGVNENFEDIKASMLKAFLGQITDEKRARHAGKTDAEIADALFDENFNGILNLQRRIYGGDFPDADSWFTLARDFLNWLASKRQHSS
jgi:hypothetical protein